MYIEKINQPTDVKNLNSEQLHVLADEMRQALLQKLSKHGGHFGPNLGMVETQIENLHIGQEVFVTVESWYGRGDNRTSLCL